MPGAMRAAMYEERSRHWTALEADQRMAPEADRMIADRIAAAVGQRMEEGLDRIERSRTMRQRVLLASASQLAATAMLGIVGGAFTAGWWGGIPCPSGPRPPATWLRSSGCRCG